MLDSTTAASGFVLEDVPHLSDYIPHLPVRPFSLFSSPTKRTQFLSGCVYIETLTSGHRK